MRSSVRSGTIEHETLRPITAAKSSTGKASGCGSCRVRSLNGALGPAGEQASDAAFDDAEFR